MRPYIMNYSETLEIKSEGVIIDGEEKMREGSSTDTTRCTFTVENSDEDSVAARDGTTITETVETEDEDSIIVGRSIFVRSNIESNAICNTSISSTFITRTIEPSDEDEIRLD